MKLFITFLGILLTCTAFGQITITNSNMPGSHDTIRYSAATPTTINYDTTGAGMTWDFSNLTPTSQGLYEYKPGLLINPIYSAFFGLTSYGRLVTDSISLGIATIKNIYDFYQNSSSAFKAVGRGLSYQGIPIPSNYSDDDEIYQFPLNYTDHDSSTFEVSFDLTTTLQLFQKGYRISDVDGWGTVITPHGTYTCIRIVSSIYEHDSLVINGFALPGFDRVSREIKWLSTNEKIPVVEVDGSVVNNTFTPNTLRYRDSWIQCLATTPAINFTADHTTGYPSETFLFSNTSACALGYQWSFSPNTITYLNGTSNTSAEPAVQFTHSGDYTAHLNAYNAAGLDSLVRTAYIHILSPAGITDEGNNTPAFQLLSDPVNNSIRCISNNTTSTRLSIFSSTGALLLQQDVPKGAQAISLNTSSWSAGLYLVRLTGEHGFNSQKLIIR